MSKAPRKRPNPEWASVSSRVAWLAKVRFSNSRSALAKAIGFSHTIVVEVAKGRAPGPRLVDAIVNRLHVDRGWLETGKGQPFPSDMDSPSRIPVADTPLPGPPASHREMLTGWIIVPEVVASPTLYWLVLKSSQPLLRQRSSGFCPGDQLLMETDPAKFPKEADIHGDLCVVRGGVGGGELRLATVRYYAASTADDGPARLEAEFPEPVQSEEGVIERVYRHHPDGELGYYERRVGQPEPRWSEPTLPVARYTDIVSVWLKILRRPVG